MSDTTYEALTMRQKGLIDVLAKNRVEDADLTNEEIVELAHELTGEKKYTPSAASRFRGKYEDIIEERVQVIANDHDNGEEGDVVTIGDPMRSYSGPEGGIDATMQRIQERPVKDTAAANGTDSTHTCVGCGKEFENAQGLGRHRVACDEIQAPDESQTLDFEFEEQQVFELIRTAEEGVAKQVFQQVWKR